MISHDFSVLSRRNNVTDTGGHVNTSSPAEPYSHGLRGVNQNQNFQLVHVLFVSFAVLLSITLIYRFTHICKSYARAVVNAGSESDQRYWQYNRTIWWPRIKADLLYAPLFRVRHNREIQLSRAIAIGTLPSRYHTLLLTLYLASNISYCLMLDWTRPNKYSVIAELRGRSGALATFNLIPTILFALRNNPLITLLKVSYDTFNLLHRWCARIVILLSTVHMACFFTNNISAGANANGVSQISLALSTSASYQWGLVASCVFLVIFVLTLGPVRHAFYETFINLHRFLAMLALIGVLIHIIKATLPQLNWIIICFMLWAAEWALRLFQILYYNVSRKQGLTRVTVEALPAEACRINFHLARPMAWRPGQHVHVYIPAIGLWSSHPFSIAWTERNSDGQSRITTGISRNTDGDLKVSEVKNMSEWSSSAGTLEMIRALDSNVTSLSLITKVRSGITLQLYNKASHAAKAKMGATYNTWGFVEGPYGGIDSLDSFGTVVLFAGGVGITHCLGYARHALRYHAAGISSTRKVLLCWSVPTTEALEWVRPWMDEILLMPGRRDLLQIEIFITRLSKRHNVISGSASVRILEGRCDPRLVMEREMGERIGAVGVTVCGPGAFADSVRKAVRDVVSLGQVDFMEEAFTY